MGCLRLQAGDYIWDVVFISVDPTDGLVTKDRLG